MLFYPYNAFLAMLTTLNNMHSSKNVPRRPGHFQKGAVLAICATMHTWITRGVPRVKPSGCPSSLVACIFDLDMVA